MLSNCASAQERWGGVSDIIDRWLKERQQVLVLFCKLSDGNQIFEENERETLLKRLCELTVDYVSAGHFEVYEQLLEEGKAFNDREGLKEAGPLFESVDKTTEVILDFNDKYQETDDLSSLTADLSLLGEAMALRFEGEDGMIEVLHYAHKQETA